MWLVSTGSVPGNLPFRLNGGEYVVGRTGDAEIMIKDLTLSRRHARLARITEEDFIVEDLGSRNGTFVNGRRGTRLFAEPGNQIRFGAVVCVVSRTAILPASAYDDETTLAVQMQSSPTVTNTGLTPAQQEILHFVLLGMDEAAIAVKLERSWHTIHTHLKAIFQHFHVHSRAQLIAKLLQQPLAS